MVEKKGVITKESRIENEGAVEKEGTAKIRGVVSKQEKMSPYVFIGVVTSLLWFLIASILGSFAAGYFLDKWLGTSPWFLLSLTLLGIFAGLYKVIIDLINLSKRV